MLGEIEYRLFVHIYFLIEIQNLKNLVEDLKKKSQRLGKTSKYYYSRL